MEKCANVRHILPLWQLEQQTGKQLFNKKTMTRCFLITYVSSWLMWCDISVRKTHTLSKDTVTHQSERHIRYQKTQWHISQEDTYVIKKTQWHINQEDTYVIKKHSDTLVRKTHTLSKNTVTHQSGRHIRYQKTQWHISQEDTYVIKKHSVIVFLLTFLIDWT